MPRPIAQVPSTRSVAARAWLALVAVAVLLAAPAAVAHEEAAPAAAAGLSPTVVQAMLADFDRSTGHLVQLAEAIPADKYSWRPAEGVRSVSEAVMHVVQANHTLATALGAEAPAGLPEDPEKAVTDKAQVVEHLKASVAAGRKALEQAAAGDLEAKKEVFGREMPAAMVAFILMGHSHEHLGQLIAYARANGVVPPWSEG